MQSLVSLFTKEKTWSKLFLKVFLVLFLITTTVWLVALLSAKPVDLDASANEEEQAAQLDSVDIANSESGTDAKVSDQKSTDATQIDDSGSGDSAKDNTEANIQDSSKSDIKADSLSQNSSDTKKIESQASVAAAPAPQKATATTDAAKNEGALLLEKGKEQSGTGWAWKDNILTLNNAHLTDSTYVQMGTEQEPVTNPKIVVTKETYNTIGYNSNYGLFVYDTEDSVLTIESTEEVYSSLNKLTSLYISAVGGNGQQAGLFIKNGGLKVSDALDFASTAGASSDSFSYGVRANKNIELGSGLASILQDKDTQHAPSSFTVTGGDAPKSSYGVCSYSGDITVLSGYVIANSGKATNGSSNGVSAAGTVTTGAEGSSQTGLVVYSTTQQAGLNSAGIYAHVGVVQNSGSFVLKGVPITSAKVSRAEQDSMLGTLAISATSDPNELSDNFINNSKDSLNLRINPYNCAIFTDGEYKNKTNCIECNVEQPASDSTNSVYCQLSGETVTIAEKLVLTSDDKLSNNYFSWIGSTNTFNLNSTGVFGGIYYAKVIITGVNEKTATGNVTINCTTSSNLIHGLCSEALDVNSNTGSTCKIEGSGSMTLKVSGVITAATTESATLKVGGNLEISDQTKTEATIGVNYGDAAIGYYVKGKLTVKDEGTVVKSVAGAVTYVAEGIRSTGIEVTDKAAVYANSSNALVTAGIKCLGDANFNAAYIEATSGKIEIPSVLVKRMSSGDLPNLEAVKSFNLNDEEEINYASIAIWMNENCSVKFVEGTVAYLTSNEWVVSNNAHILAENALYNSYSVCLYMSFKTASTDYSLTVDGANTQLNARCIAINTMSMGMGISGPHTFSCGIYCKDSNSQNSDFDGENNYVNITSGATVNCEGGLATTSSYGALLDCGLTVEDATFTTYSSSVLVSRGFKSSSNEDTIASIGLKCNNATFKNSTVTFCGASATASVGILTEGQMDFYACAIKASCSSYYGGESCAAMYSKSNDGKGIKLYDDGTSLKPDSYEFDNVDTWVGVEGNSKISQADTTKVLAITYKNTSHEVITLRLNTDAPTELTSHFISWEVIDGVNTLTIGDGEHDVNLTGIKGIEVLPESGKGDTFNETVKVVINKGNHVISSVADFGLYFANELSGTNGYLDFDASSTGTLNVSAAVGSSDTLKATAGILANGPLCFYGGTITATGGCADSTKEGLFSAGVASLNSTVLFEGGVKMECSAGAGSSRAFGVYAMDKIESKANGENVSPILGFVAPGIGYESENSICAGLYCGISDSSKSGPEVSISNGTNISIAVNKNKSPYVYTSYGICTAETTMKDTIQINDSSFVEIVAYGGKTSVQGIHTGTLNVEGNEDKTATPTLRINLAAADTSAEELKATSIYCNESMSASNKAYIYTTYGSSFCGSVIGIKVDTNEEEKFIVSSDANLVIGLGISAKQYCCGIECNTLNNNGATLNLARASSSSKSPAVIGVISSESSAVRQRCYGIWTQSKFVQNSGSVKMYQVDLYNKTDDEIPCEFYGILTGAIDEPTTSSSQVDINGGTVEINMPYLYSASSWRYLAEQTENENSDVTIVGLGTYVANSDASLTVYFNDGEFIINHGYSDEIDDWNITIYGVYAYNTITSAYNIKLKYTYLNIDEGIGYDDCSVLKSVFAAGGIDFGCQSESIITYFSIVNCIERWTGEGLKQGSKTLTKQDKNDPLIVYWSYAHPLVLTEESTDYGENWKWQKNKDGVWQLILGNPDTLEGAKIYNSSVIIAGKKDDWQNTPISSNVEIIVVNGTHNYIGTTINELVENEWYVSSSSAIVNKLFVNNKESNTVEFKTSNPSAHNPGYLNLTYWNPHEDTKTTQTLTSGGFITNGNLKISSGVCNIEAVLADSSNDKGYYYNGLYNAVIADSYAAIKANDITTEGDNTELNVKTHFRIDDTTDPGRKGKANAILCNNFTSYAKQVKLECESDKENDTFFSPTNIVQYNGNFTLASGSFSLEANCFCSSNAINCTGDVSLGAASYSCTLNSSKASFTGIKATGNISLLEISNAKWKVKCTKEL